MVNGRVCKTHQRRFDSAYRVQNYKKEVMENNLEHLAGQCLNCTVTLENPMVPHCGPCAFLMLKAGTTGGGVKFGYEEALMNRRFFILFARKEGRFL